MCIILSDGDITKRDNILWNYTLQEIQPYVKHSVRKILFREAVLSFLGVKDLEETDNEYCIACKKSRGVTIDEEDDLCKTCNKEIKIENRFNKEQ
ncbi:MAG TPA: hypothetical protein PLU14_00325 [Caldisericia bacterium]|nr:hypothetical protein [Caldisericia bacterium]